VAEVSAKNWGYAAIAFGVLAVLVAVLADPLGIGGVEGFGWKHGFLLSLGVSVALGGVGIMRGWFDGLRRRKAGEATRAPKSGSSPAHPLHRRPQA
jgi:predicted phage tail protein